MQRQHNAPSEKLEPFTWGVKRMDTALPVTRDLETAYDTSRHPGQ